MPNIIQVRQVLLKAPAVVVAPSGFTTWDPATKNTDITLDVTNLNASIVTTGAFKGVRSVASHSTGDFYCELTCVNAPFPGFSHFGVGNASASLSTFLGGDANAAVMTGNGDTSCNSVSFGTGQGFNGTQTAGMAVRLTTKKIWFWNSATGQWNADVIGNQNPATGTGGFDISTIASGPYFIVLDMWETASSYTLNAGGSAHVIGTPPTGFGNW